MAGVTAVVLAGGLGTRLRGTVDDLPKVLAPIHGRPFLKYLLDRLSVSGVRRAVLCTGYLGDLVERTIGTHHGSMRVTCSKEGEPLGTGGALRLALASVDDELLLVLNGDSYCSADLVELVQRHLASKARASIVLTKVPDAGRFGRVWADSRGQVLRFAEKEPGSEPGWVNAGIYMVDRDVVESIPESRFVSLEREIFPALIDRGLSAFPIGGRFIDIGTPDSYAEASIFFKERVCGDL